MTEKIEIAHEGDSDEGAWIYATPDGICVKTRCEGGLHPIGDGLTVPWADVLKHAPIAAIVKDLAGREGVLYDPHSQGYYEIFLEETYTAIFVLEDGAQ